MTRLRRFRSAIRRRTFLGGVVGAAVATAFPRIAVAGKRLFPMLRPSTVAQLGLLGGNLKYSTYYYQHNFYVDVLNASDRFLNSTGSADAALDANGFPAEAWRVCVSSAQCNAPNGVYLGTCTSADGTPVTMTALAGCSISQSTVGNVTNFTVTVSAGTAAGTLVNISGSRAATYVKIVRPGFAVDTATVFNPDALDYFKTYSGLRPMQYASTEGFGNTPAISSGNSLYPNWTGSPVNSAVVTISLNNPGVVAWTAHGATVGRQVYFTTTGTLPWPLTRVVSFFVHTVVDADHFTLCRNPGDPQIETLDAGSGVHTCYNRGRHTPTNSKTGLGQNGVRWEDVAAIGNAVYGAANSNLKYLWVNVPTTASDSYVTSLATLLRDTLDSRIVIVVEYGNENWNSLYHSYYHDIFKVLEQLDAYYYNNSTSATELKQVASITRTSNVATVTLNVPHDWGAVSATKVIDTVVAADSTFSANGVTATIASSTSFTYPSTGSDSAGVTLTNSIFIGNPSHTLNYDHPRSMSVLQTRNSAKRTREIALLFETVFGSLGDRVQVVLGYQVTGTDTGTCASLSVGTLMNHTGLRALEYLDTQFVDRQVRSYIKAFAIAPYSGFVASVPNDVAGAFAAQQTFMDGQLIKSCYCKAMCSIFGLEAWTYEVAVAVADATYTNLTIATGRLIVTDALMRSRTYDLLKGLLDRGFRRLTYYNVSCQQLDAMATYPSYWESGESITGADSQRRLAQKDVLALIPNHTLGKNVLDASSVGATTTVQAAVASVRNFLRTPSHAFSGSTVSWTANANGCGFANGATFADAQWIEFEVTVAAPGTWTLCLSTSLNAGANLTWTAQLDKGTAIEQAAQNYTVVASGTGNAGVTAYNTQELAMTLAKGTHIVRIAPPVGTTRSLNLGVLRFTKA